MPAAAYASPLVFGTISLLLGSVVLFSSRERNWLRVVAFCALVIVSSVTDDDALRSVMLGIEGLANVLGAGAVHVSMSTVSPTLSLHLAEVHARHGQGYVAAPVLGNPDAVRIRCSIPGSTKSMAERSSMEPTVRRGWPCRWRSRT
jgi:hypothetical protein